MAKVIYLVRHGETDSNVGDVHRGDAALLTDHGRKQARVVGERCANLDIDIVIASTLERAKETADIINKRIKKPVIQSSVFVERKYPSIAIGRKKTDSDIMHLEKIVDDHLHVSGYRHSDEESAHDLLQRAHNALSYLIEQPEQNILVVSHAMFSRALVACVLFGTDTTIRDIAQCMRVLKVANTGLSILRYDLEDPYGPWRLICWNDHAHLG